MRTVTRTITLPASLTTSARGALCSLGDALAAGHIDELNLVWRDDLFHIVVGDGPNALALENGSLDGLLLDAAMHTKDHIDAAAKAREGQAL